MIKKKIRFNMAYFTAYDPMNEQLPQGMIQLYYGTLTDDRIFRKLKYANQGKSIVLDRVNRFDKTYLMTEGNFIRAATGMNEEQIKELFK